MWSDFRPLPAGLDFGRVFAGPHIQLQSGMLFNSWEYAVFLFTTSLIYFCLPAGGRWLWLLLASCVFYLTLIPEYILVLGGLDLGERAAGLAAPVRWTAYFALVALIVGSWIYFPQESKGFIYFQF